MGTSREVRYTVEVVVDKGYWTPTEWRMRARGQAPGYGKATEENLRNYCLKVEESTHKGGCNEHIGVTHILSAFIKDHHTGQILATYKRV